MSIVSPDLTFNWTGQQDDYQYLCCPKGHKLFVVWMRGRQAYGFTCDHCEALMEIALGEKGAAMIVRIPAEAKVTKLGPHDVS